MNPSISILRTLRPIAAMSLVSIAACDLSVTNPGPIQDSQLNNSTVIPALVNGMSGDLSVAVGLLSTDAPVMADGLSNASNLVAPGHFAAGLIRPEDVNGDWSSMQRARWVAETGLVRINTVLGAGFEANANVPRAYLYGGFANRLLGENSCTAVIDGSAPQSDSVYFQRADSLFTRAIALATAQKNTTVLTAAYGGRASVRADLGNWTGAVADAQQVPLAFHFDATMSLNTPRENNNVVQNTVIAAQLSVYGTPWASTNTDPRTPWDTAKTSSGAVQKGQNGTTPWFRQGKYKTLAASIPLTKGAEMLLIQAEAALRNSDVSGAVALVNQERASYKLPAASAPSEQAAWTLLERERGAVLWLEGRRLWDLRRWNAATGPAHNSFLDKRDKCIPISANEASSNPNIPSAG